MSEIVKDKSIDKSENSMAKSDDNPTKTEARSTETPLDGEVSRCAQHINRSLSQMYISYKSIHNNELSVLVPNVSMIIE